MRRMLFLLVLAPSVACNVQNSVDWQMRIPPLAEMRALVPADLVPSLPPVDPKADGQLEFEKAVSTFPKSQPDLRDYPDLAAIRKKRAQLAKELDPWNPSLDAVVSASRARNWSRLRARPLGAKQPEPSDIQPPVEFPNIANPKNSVKLLLLRARLRLDMEPQKAIEDYLAAIRIGDRLQSGREPIVGFLIGSAITGMADAAILDDLPQMPAGMTKRLLAETPNQADLPKRFAETLRVELGDSILWFHFTLVETDKVLEKGDRPIIAALKDHPNPFDLKDSIECLGKLTRADIATLASPPPSTKPSEVASKMRPGFGDLPSVGEEAGWPEPETLKVLLRAVPNPLGRMLISGMMEFDDLWEVSIRPQATAAAISVLIASHLYSLQFGKPPSTLDELVRTHLLTAVPKDPFGTGPLHYDAKRKVIWSNGPDRKDDGGLDTPFKFKDARDMVWSLDGHKEAR